MTREVIISCSYLLHSDKLDAGCEAALFEKQRERRAQAGTWIWGSRLRAVPQLQLCRSPGSPEKATCGAGYLAGAPGDSLPCGNPRDAVSPFPFRPSDDSDTWMGISLGGKTGEEHALPIAKQPEN